MTFLKVMGFSLLVLLVFTGFANILPQVQSDPPAEEVIDTAALDMPGLIAYGEKVFRGKGTCTLCHNDLGRAPDLLELDLAATFPSRLVDARYEGAAAGDEGADAVEAYIRESMSEPSAFVVAGFGKKGTGDTVSPMPIVSAPPIELTDVQMDAVIAFLQDRAGMEPTVPLPSAAEAADAVDTADAQDSAPDQDPPATDMAGIFDKYFCNACHDLDGSEAEVGPRLNGIANRMGRGEIMVSILDPIATIAEGFEPDMMPADFGDQMYASELTMIVDFLQNLPE